VELSGIYQYFIGPISLLIVRVTFLWGI